MSSSEICVWSMATATLGTVVLVLVRSTFIATGCNTDRVEYMFALGAAIGLNFCWAATDVVVGGKISMGSVSLVAMASICACYL